MAIKKQQPIKKPDTGFAATSTEVVAAPIIEPVISPPLPEPSPLSDLRAPLIAAEAAYRHAIQRLEAAQTINNIIARDAALPPYHQAVQDAWQAVLDARAQFLTVRKVVV